MILEVLEALFHPSVLGFPWVPVQRDWAHLSGLWILLVLVFHPLQVFQKLLHILSVPYNLVFLSLQDHLEAHWAQNDRSLHPCQGLQADLVVQQIPASRWSHWGPVAQRGPGLLYFQSGPGVQPVQGPQVLRTSGCFYQLLVVQVLLGLPEDPEDLGDRAPRLFPSRLEVQELQSLQVSLCPLDSLSVLEDPDFLLPLDSPASHWFLVHPSVQLLPVAPEHRRTPVSHMALEVQELQRPAVQDLLAPPSDHGSL